jgi:hypothetical protein
MKNLIFSATVLTAAIILVSCSNNTITNSSTTEVPAIYRKIYGASDIYVEGNYVVIKSNGITDHKSPYYLGTQWESSKYEAYNGPNSNFMMNPSRIVQQNITFKIPLNPAVDPNHRATPLGPIGVALNGIPIFNQYAGNGQPLTNEINSFDQYEGHPQQSGSYHYHAEPFYITANSSDSALVGFLLDGFPVYGPKENGVIVTNNDLDIYHGHFGVKDGYPNGIYHYHTTSEAPYINGDGFYGTQGTVTN